jgi:hypothetical protein
VILSDPSIIGSSNGHHATPLATTIEGIEFATQALEDRIAALGATTRVAVGLVHRIFREVALESRPAVVDERLLEVGLELVKKFDEVHAPHHEPGTEMMEVRPGLLSADSLPSGLPG